MLTALRSDTTLLSCRTGNPQGSYSWPQHGQLYQSQSLCGPGQPRGVFSRLQSAHAPSTAADRSLCCKQPGEAEGRGWVSSCTRSFSCLHRLYIEQGLHKRHKLTRQQMQKKRLKRERGSQGSPGWLGAELRGEARPPKPPPGAFLSLCDASSSSAILLFFSQEWLLFSQSPSHV